MQPPGIHRATDRKPAFDAASKTGLLPRHNVSVLNDATTYVMAGTATSGRPSKDLLRSAALQSGNGSGGYIQGIREGPTVREAQKAIEQEKKRKRATKKELQDLMQSDMGRSLGGTYLESAVTRREEQEDEFRRKNGMGGRVVEKKKERVSDREEEVRLEEQRKKSFPVAAVRKIGYDPSHKGDAPRDDDDETRRTRVSTVLLTRVTRTDVVGDAARGYLVVDGESTCTQVVRHTRYQVSILRHGSLSSIAIYQQRRRPARSERGRGK